MFYLTVAQTVFVILIPLIVVIGGAVLLYFIYQQKHLSTNYKKRYYKKVYQVALDQDLLLVNQFPIDISSDFSIEIDHLLLGEKYIYLIMDYYYDGIVTGNVEDKSLILVDKNNKKSYVDNPFLLMQKILYRFSIVSGINASLITSLILINDNCEMKLPAIPAPFRVVKKNEFVKFVEELEKTNIKNINQEQLIKAAEILAKVKNERHQKIR